MTHKSPITLAIEAAYGCTDYQRFVAVTPRPLRKTKMPHHIIKGRKPGLTHATFMYNEQLLTHVITPILTPANRQPPSMQHIVAYDPGHGEEKAVECTLRRDPVTGVITIMSSDVVERKSDVRSVVCIDEWPWF
ncbi:TPA: hypothetical protein ACYSHJ_004463 [Serratia marcescens]